MLKDLNIVIDNFKIYEDNQSTIKSVQTYDQRKLKHLEIKYNFIKSKVEQGVVKVEYIRSQYQLADIFTKPVGKCPLIELICKLGIIVVEAEEEC